MARRKKAATSAVQGKNPLNVRDTLFSVSAFVSSEEFAFFAIASKLCRNVWGNRPQTTRAINVHSTPAQLAECLDMGLERHPRVCWRAAKHGLLSVLKYARSRGCPIDNYNANLAAFGGHCDMLAWLIQIGCQVDEGACFNAARNGHLRCLKYLRSVGCAWDYLTCLGAARWGHTDVLKWALSEECPCSTRVMYAAAEGGDMAIVEIVIAYMDAKGLVVENSSLCGGAASGGHTHVLEWAKQRGCKWTADVARLAALHGHLHVFKWGEQQGCYLSKEPSVMRWAAASGNTDLLGWMLEHGFEYDSGLCKLAVRHLGVLQWAHALDPSLLNESVWQAAVEKKNSRVTNWLKHMGCPGSE